MRSIVTLVAAAIFLLGLGATVQCPGEGAARHQRALSSGDVQLLGFTETEVFGDLQLFRMTLACQEEFPESRVCESQEILATVDIPYLPEYAYAWVRPTYVTNTFDASGAKQPGSFSMNCLQWTTQVSQRGLTVGDHGWLFPLPCNVERPIACCGEVQHVHPWRD